MIRPSRRAAALSGPPALGLSGLLVAGIGLSGGDPAGAVAAESRATVPSTPASGSPEQPDVPAPSSSEVSRSTAPVTPSSPIHLVVGAVGLDLPVLPLTPRRGVIDPPTLTAAYWIEPYGDPVGSAEQATNTLYIAAHSAGSGHDGFDPLLTADHRSGAVVAGDVIEVRTPGGTVAYTVERTARYDKDELADAGDVWESVPGRLVLITCFQQTNGRPATENFVVVAHSAG